MRPDSIACFNVRTTCSCPTTSSNVIGRYFSGSATCCRPSSACPFFAMESNSALNKQRAAQEPPRAAEVVVAAAAALRQAQAEPRQAQAEPRQVQAPQQAQASPPRGRSTDTRRRHTRSPHTSHSGNVDAAHDLAANRADSAVAHHDEIRGEAAERHADHDDPHRGGVSHASDRDRAPCGAGDGRAEQPKRHRQRSSPQWQK